MAARIEQVGEMTVVALRHMGPYDQIGNEFGNLFEWTKKHHVNYDRCLAIYRDDPKTVPSHELRSDACVVVSEDFVLPNTDGLDLRLDTIPAGEYGAITYVGPYDGLNQAWGQFANQDLPEMGRTADYQVSFEIYTVAGPGIAPSEQRTDLYMSLA